MPDARINLRLATRADVATLDAIAFAAKAHWGYTTEQLESWRSDLVIHPNTMEACPVCVAEVRGEIAGLLQVATDTRPWQLTRMWVRPENMREGVGTALVGWAKNLAQGSGQASIAIDADPNAEGFYLACGAVRVGEVAAPIEGQPGRVRPQLVLPASERQAARP